MGKESLRAAGGPDRAAGKTSSVIKRQWWEKIRVAVSGCGRQQRSHDNCRKRFDDIKQKLKKKIQQGILHASATGGGPAAEQFIACPLEEQLAAKLTSLQIAGVNGDLDIGVYEHVYPEVCPASPIAEDTMNMDPEFSYETPACHSHTSMPVEEDKIIVRSLSPSIRPCTNVPEQNACSNSTKEQTHDADVGLQQHLLGFERCEEKLMLIHRERHEQLMGVQGEMLAEMREIKEIMRNTN
ncbi:uncharacterized protein LOC142488823 [Ascaphus truei]|uniref:uncharacterized protein LOC142488823 n=1 Tax=Ascaphus truei TaxID=8439 RepID=UPI003F59235F